MADDKKKEPKNTPDRDKKVDNQDGDDLKNVDKSRGGYGDDTGFDKGKKKD